MSVRRLHGGERTPTVGARFTLPEETFLAWWESVPPEDRNEFSHFMGGTRLLARFVCALDYLKTVAADEHDPIARAFALAHNIEYSEVATNFIRREQAQGLWEHQATRFLIEALRYRNRRDAEDRIARRTAAKLEELYARAEARVALLEETGGLGAAIGDADLAKLENNLLVNSNMYLARESKERVAMTSRRNQAALKDAIDAQVQREADALRPPTKEQLASYLAQLSEQVGGPEVLIEMLTPKLPPPEAPNAE